MESLNNSGLKMRTTYIITHFALTTGFSYKQKAVPWARDTPVVKHFNQTDNANALFASLIIEAINPDVENHTTTSFRRSQETYWIQLGTLKLLGLNDHA